MTTERLLIKVVADTRDAVQKVDALGKTSSSRLGAAGKSAEGFSASLDKVGTRLVGVGAAATAAGATMAAGLTVAALAAQDLADSVDKAQATFGTAGAASLDGFAAQAATNLGKSKAAALDAASAYGLLLKQRGIGGSALARQSAELATRTADLAERFKQPYEEVQKSIENVLKTGSARSLRGLLGVDIQIDPNSLKGLGTAERTAKVLDEVLRQTADSANFFARSTDDVGVKIAQTQAKWENARAAFGEASLPALTALADGASSLLGIFNAMPDGAKAAAGSIATVATAVALLGGPLSTVAGLGAKAFAPLVGEGTRLGTTLASLGVTSASASAALGVVAPAAIAGTLAFEAWASETAQVDAAIQKLTASITTLDDAGQTLPTLAGSLREILSNNSGGGDVFAKTGLSVNDVTTAVNAAPGAFDRFRDSVDGLGGVLDNLGGFLSFGDDIAGLREEATKAGPAVARTVEHLIDLYEAGGLSADEFRKTIDYIVDLDRSASNSSKSLAAQARDLRDVAGAAAFTGQALADYKTVTDGTGSLDEQVAALNRLKTAFPEAARAVGLLPPALAETEPAAASAGRAVTNFAERVEAAAERVKAAGKDLTLTNLAAEATSPARAAIGYEQAALRYEQAQKRLADANSVDKRNEALRDSLDKVADAQDGLTSAIERRRKAQEKLNDLTKKSVVAGSVPLLQEIAKAADAGVKDAEARLAAARAQFGEGSKEAVAAQGLVTAAQGRRTESLGLLDRGLAEQGGKNQRAIRDAQAEVSSSDRDIAKAVRDKSEAESDYRKTLTDGTDATTARKQALLDFWSASLDKYEAAAALAQAAQDGLDPYGALRDIVAQTADNAGIAAGQVEGFKGAIDEAGAAAAGALGLIAPLLQRVTTELDRANQGLAQREGVPSFQTTPNNVPANAPRLGGGTAGAGTAAPSSPPRQATQRLGPTTYRDPRTGDIYQWDGRRWQKLSAGDAARIAAGPVGRFADGGSVPDLGLGPGDSVPALLTAGEFVLTRAAVDRYGTDALKALNKGRAGIQKFATGGTVRGPVSVPASSFVAMQTPARTSGAVEVKPAFYITATDPKEAADESVRKLRRATFLAGVR